MRLIIAAGVLVFSTGPALGDYLVDLDAGDRMTVDSYWVDGDRVHLVRGGIDLTVPRSRIRSVRESGQAAMAEVPARTASANPPAPTASARAHASRGDLEAEQRRIEHHLLRVQKERSEAAARNAPGSELKRLEREFRRTQARRLNVMRELAAR